MSYPFLARNIWKIALGVCVIGLFFLILPAAIQWFGDTTSAKSSKNTAAKDRQARAALVFKALPTTASDDTRKSILPAFPKAANPGVNNAKAIALKALAGVNSLAPDNRVAAIIGQLTDKSYAVRHGAVNALPTNLSLAEVDTLERFLVQRGVGGLTNEQARTLKNDLLNELRAQSSPPEGLDQTLITIYRDPEQESGMRDFAVQHLAAWYDKVDAAKQPEVRRALVEALNEHSGGIAGTAMIGLYRLSCGDHPEIDRSALSAAARAAVTEAGTDELTRMAAVQIDAQMHDPALLSVALALATSPTTSMTLRTVAVAAIGDVGNQANIAALEAWASGPEPRLHLAAQAALTRLKNRSQ